MENRIIFENAASPTASPLQSDTPTNKQVHPVSDVRRIAMQLEEFAKEGAETVTNFTVDPLPDATQPGRLKIDALSPFLLESIQDSNPNVLPQSPAPEHQNEEAKIVERTVQSKQNNKPTLQKDMSHSDVEPKEKKTQTVEKESSSSAVEKLNRKPTSQEGMSSPNIELKEKKTPSALKESSSSAVEKLNHKPTSPKDTPSPNAELKDKITPAGKDESSSAAVEELYLEHLSENQTTKTAKNNYTSSLNDEASTLPSEASSQPLHLPATEASSPDVIVVPSLPVGQSSTQSARAFPRVTALPPRTGSYTPRAGTLSPRSGAFSPRPEALSPNPGTLQPLISSQSTPRGSNLISLAARRARRVNKSAPMSPMTSVDRSLRVPTRKSRSSGASVNSDSPSVASQGFGEPGSPRTTTPEPFNLRSIERHEAALKKFEDFVEKQRKTKSWYKPFKARPMPDFNN